MLLIVPYGIETPEVRSLPMFHELLIVPYGIETVYGELFGILSVDLLIVPYGIETGYSIKVDTV